MSDSTAAWGREGGRLGGKMAEDQGGVEERRGEGKEIGEKGGDVVMR